MEKLIILNTILVWLLIIFMIIKPYLHKLTIEINRTFLGEKPYGFNITKWEYKAGTYPNNGVGIFHFNWRNPNNIKDSIEKARK